MSVSYKKLFYLMIERDISTSELIELAGFFAERLLLGAMKGVNRGTRVVEETEMVPQNKPEKPRKQGWQGAIDGQRERAILVVGAIGRAKCGCDCGSGAKLLVERRSKHGQQRQQRRAACGRQSCVLR